MTELTPRPERGTLCAVTLVLTMAEAAVVSGGLKLLERRMALQPSKDFIRNLRAVVDEARGQTIKQAKIIHRGD